MTGKDCAGQSASLAERRLQTSELNLGDACMRRPADGHVWVHYASGLDAPLEPTAQDGPLPALGCACYLNHQLHARH